MVSTREKGVRRPLGDINVNQASSSSGNNSSNSGGPNNGGPTVVKLPSKSSSGSQKTPVTNQKFSWSKTQSSSSFDDDRSTVTTTASLQFKSIFRQPPPKFDDCLALKPANPITEPATDERDESDEVRDDDVESDFSPFIRDDDTRVIESFDTAKLRNIFRPVLSCHGSTDDACADELDDSASDGMLLLKRASPILSEEDLRDPRDHDDDNNNNNNNNKCDEWPTTLDWNNLFSENTPIIYKI